MFLWSFLVAAFKIVHLLYEEIIYRQDLPSETSPLDKLMPDLSQ